MNFLLILILCLVVLFLIVTAVISIGMSRRLSEPRHKSYEETIRRAKEDEHSYGNFDSYEKEPFTAVCRDGYELHGDFLPLDPARVVVISHGHGDNKYTGIRFVQVFRKLGYSTVIYDERGHGNNQPAVTTMGLDESKDLIELLEVVKERFPGAEIGLHGLSMGAGLTVTALKYRPDVRFVVADCGYARLKDLCIDELKSVCHVPAWMFAPVNWCSRLRYGYNAEDVNPIDSLTDNEIPICFIHGKEDKLISYKHSKRMYERNKGDKKELHLISGADHAQSWVCGPAYYEEIVGRFIEYLPEKIKMS